MKTKKKRKYYLRTSIILFIAQLLAYYGNSSSDNPISNQSFAYFIGYNIFVILAVINLILYAKHKEKSETNDNNS